VKTVSYSESKQRLGKVW